MLPLRSSLSLSLHRSASDSSTVEPPGVACKLRYKLEKCMRDALHSNVKISDGKNDDYTQNGKYKIEFIVDEAKIE